MPGRKKNIKPKSEIRYSYDEAEQMRAAEHVDRINRERKGMTAAQLQDLSPDKLAMVANRILDGQLECAWTNRIKKKATQQEIPTTRSDENGGEGDHDQPIPLRRSDQAEEVRVRKKTHRKSKPVRGRGRRA